MLTCQHVIDGAAVILAGVGASQPSTAGIIVESVRRDLAVLSTSVTPSALGDVLHLSAGPIAAPLGGLIACGFPGAGRAKATRIRLVSVPPSRRGLLEPAELLQLRGAIRAGNSGGPLLDPENDIMGIIQASYGSDASWGFASPAPRASRLVAAAMARTSLTDPVWFQAVYGDTEGGVQLLGTLRGSAVAGALPESGDAFITAVNGAATSFARDVQKVLGETQDPYISVTLRSGATERTLIAPLTKPPTWLPTGGVDGPSDTALAGARLTDLGPITALAFGIPHDLRGVLVLRVGDSIADQVGFEAGDVITAVNGKEVSSSAELATRLRPGAPLSLTVERGAEVIEASFVSSVS